MIRIAVCDDSSEFLNQTKAMLDQWRTSVGVELTVELFEDGDSFLSAHSKNPFDIILLDVVMPMLNGLETARELRQADQNVKIVFLTHSPDFAVESYTVKASNYLLKPVDPTKLFDCLNELISVLKTASKGLIVKGLDATYRLAFSNLEYVESQSKYNIFHTVDQRIVKTHDALYLYENTLTPEAGFLKCHRSYIVNVHCIESYSHTEIVMRSGCHIPISRSHQKTFESMYFSIVFEKAGEDL